MKILSVLHPTKKRVIVIIILILGILGIYNFFIKPKPQNIQNTQVKRQDLKSVVSASGILTGRSKADLKFKISGKLAYVNVAVGDKVTKNQVIAGLNTQDLEIALQQARNTLTDKQATVDKIHDDVKGHDKDETFTQRQTRTTAEAAVNNAFDAVKAAQRAFQDAVITSPIDGIVTQAIDLPGQVVSSTDLIAQVISTDEIFFDAEVDESDLGKVGLGQQADITFNAYENKIFPGQVTEIKPITTDTSTGATVVLVRISLGNPTINFVTGLNGQAEIIYKQAENVLTVPIEALKDDSTVIVQDGKKYQARKIKTGISSDTDIEVIEGLNENEKVVTNPSLVKL